MIASHLLHSTLECQEKTSRSVSRASKKNARTLQQAAASLLPMLSFGYDERTYKDAQQKKAEEIVWIEGTVTVSF